MDKPIENQGHEPAHDPQLDRNLRQSVHIAIGSSVLLAGEVAGITYEAGHNPYNPTNAALIAVAAIGTAGLIFGSIKDWFDIKRDIDVRDGNRLF